MSTLINLSPELESWILHNIERGCSSMDIVAAMVQQQFDHKIASTLVQAIIDARKKNTSIPKNGVMLELTDEQYQYETSRIANSPQIHTADRQISIRMRIAQPLVLILDNVLSADECRQVIDLARHRLQASTVVDPTTGNNLATNYRNSAGMFFKLEENPLIATLDRRISQLMNLPIENGEGLQVLHYKTGCKSEPHFDYLIPSNDFNRQSLVRSGQRVSSLVVYLNDVDAGGETYFPEIGLSVAPKRGSAVYFEYANSFRQVDPKSLHASAAVTEGEKWAMTKWMREKKFIPANTNLENLSQM